MPDPIGELVVKTQRSTWLRRHWCLYFVHNGVNTLIAEGDCWGKRTAAVQAQVWARIWLRKHGRLNT